MQIRRLWEVEFFFLVHCSLSVTAFRVGLLTTLDHLCHSSVVLPLGFAYREAEPMQTNRLLKIYDLEPKNGSQLPEGRRHVTQVSVAGCLIGPPRLTGWTECSSCPGRTFNFDQQIFSDFDRSFPPKWEIPAEIRCKFNLISTWGLISHKILIIEFFSIEFHWNLPFNPCPLADDIEMELNKVLGQSFELITCRLRRNVWPLNSDIAAVFECATLTSSSSLNGPSFQWSFI